MHHLLLNKKADFISIYFQVFVPNTFVYQAALHKTLRIEIEVESHLYRLYRLLENRVSTNKRIDSNNRQ